MASINKSEHYVFNQLSIQDADKYMNLVKSRKNVQACDSYKRIEPRTRNIDYTSALSFEVFDPLWMLTRQWQFGRFKGNDCGSLITSKVRASRRKLDSIYLKGDKDNRKEFSIDKPIEYDVEKRNHPVTPFVRVESALFFKKILEQNEVQNREEIIKELIEIYPLDPFVPIKEEKEKDIDTLKIEQNANLKRLYATYGKRIFDGYQLYQNKKNGLPNELNGLLEKYQTWFLNKYFPLANENDNCWNEQKMGYEIGMGQGCDIYDAEDYHSGKLSWYSFDARDNIQKDGDKEIKYLSYIPVPADFPGAPSKRFWEFENAQVQFGHQSDEDFKLLANSVVMQYVSMYGNDWMMTPLESKTGTVLDVEGIVVMDTFGEYTFINTSAEQTDRLSKETSFTDRWSLFGTVKANAYEKDDFMPVEGLLFPPVLRRNEESKPLEEIQFLRDEMANMLWGVESIISDGCDGTLNGKEISDAVLEVVDDQIKRAKELENPDDLQTGEEGDDKEDKKYDPDYSFLIQNRVPVNWIPFIPQKIEGEKRDIRFRRGKMPVYYNDIYQSVRPSTELLKIRKKADNTITPFYINEEEVTGYGVKLVLTAQRTRWFEGKSFNWIGAKKVISQYQANSGLMFDELIDNQNNKAIRLSEKEK